MRYTLSSISFLSAYWVVCLLLFSHASTAGRIEELVDKCCSLGSSWFVSSTYSCSRNPLTYSVNQSQSKSGDDDLSTCQALANVCCTSMRKARKCAEGKQEILVSGSCARLNRPSKSTEEFNDDVKECCNCCHLGSIQRQLDKSRCFFPVQLTSSVQCLESYVDCCSRDPQVILSNLKLYHNITTTSALEGSGASASSSDFSNGLANDNSLSSSDHRHPQTKFTESSKTKQTQHRNGATDRDLQNNSPHLEEKTPQVLAPPTQSSGEHENYENSYDNSLPSYGDPLDYDSPSFMSFAGKPTTTVNLGKQQICLKGYAWNKVTQNCEDIDECVIGLANCPSPDMCFNTDGGFECVDYGDYNGGDGDDTYGDEEDGDYGDMSEDTSNNEIETYKQTTKATAKSTTTPTTTTTTTPTTTTTTSTTATTTPTSTTTTEAATTTKSKTSFNHFWSRFHFSESTSSKPTTKQYFSKPTSVTSPALVTAKPASPMTPPIVISVSVGRHDSFRNISPATESRHNQYYNKEGRYNRHNSEVHPDSTPTCPAGYQYSSRVKQCIDLNECERSSTMCQSHEMCENTFGSYRCVTKHLTCPPGYTPSKELTRCLDVDECERGQHSCPPTTDCVNMAGSYKCVTKQCSSGYRLSRTNGRCEPISCPHGFVYNQKDNECVDMDECQIWLSQLCLPGQDCINTIGSYLCQYSITCSNGFEIDQSNGQCKDIDECIIYGTSACASTAECQNTQGSYSCLCKAGFQSDPSNPLSCLDVDECSQQWICHHNCHNSWGSYECSCQIGYRLNSDKRTCQDIDECAPTNKIGPVCHGLCQNTDGSYRCYCPSGYAESYDRRSCKDVDECRQNPNICGGPDEICTNTVGGYKCQTVTCPYKFTRVRDPRFSSENNVRCQKQRSPCSQKDHQCIKSPLSFSAHFIAIQAKMLRTPANLFTMRGPESTTKQLRFSLKVVSAVEPLTGRDNALSNQHFHLKQVRSNEAIIQMIRDIEKPVDVELQLDMHVYTRTNFLTGTAVAKIFIYVTRDPWESQNNWRHV